ncbi:cation transport protein ChaC [Inquilinus ginsengisoli]
MAAPELRSQAEAAKRDTTPLPFAPATRYIWWMADGHHDWKTPNLPLTPGEPLWVFGYGSLMWNPGFPHLERQPAVLHGYHRRFCVLSHRYRGTPERPGLVLGLDRGGSCRGMAFKVAPEHVQAVVAYLWEREMVTGVYRPSLKQIRLPDGPATACCFLADRRHHQYRGALDVEETLAMIRTGIGSSGPNRDYLLNTVEHLRELGIRDGALFALAERVAKAVEPAT